MRYKIEVWANPATERENWFTKSLVVEVASEEKLVEIAETIIGSDWRADFTPL